MTDSKLVYVPKFIVVASLLTITGYRQDGDIDLTCDTSSGVGALTGVIPTCTRIICDAGSIQFGSYLPLAPYYVGSEV